MKPPGSLPGAISSPGETHFVLIPSYNTGARLVPTVLEALQQWPHVFVVVDGSTDGSADALGELCDISPGLQVIHRLHNGGKGAAVFDGLRAAMLNNFTHALVMDADGQHPAKSIPQFMSISKRNRHAMVLGEPQFDATAPRLRVLWRRLSNILTRLETLAPVADSLFGFRVYPIADLLSEMQQTHRMRRFDFDTEALVRLSWRGVPAISHPASVQYFNARQGGVSHFRYGRDNLLLAGMHLRLLAISILRLAGKARTSLNLESNSRHRAVD